MMELKPFLHEAEVALEDDFKLTLTLDYRVISQLEGMFGKGMMELLGDLVTSCSTMTQFLWFMTRKHHEDLSADVIAGLQYSEKYGQVIVAALGSLVKHAFKLTDANG
jgi:hypothetical protein